MNAHNRTKSEEFRQVAATIPTIPIASHFPLLLPIEVSTALEDTYKLYVLSTDPVSILPPGKSLLSTFGLDDTSDGKKLEENESLEDQVTRVVQRAFWDEALESLSSSNHPTVLDRIHNLYTDLHTSLHSILPQSHPLMTTFSSPLSPTPSPLNSALIHLRELLNALKQRCAPARDEEVHFLLSKADEPLLSPDALPPLIIELMKGVLTLIEHMKADVHNFVLANVSEKDVKAFLRTQGRTNERKIVEGLYGPLDHIQSQWNTWIDATERKDEESDKRHKWVSRLVQALTTPEAISIPMPTAPSTLPAPASSAPSTPPTNPPNLIPPPLLIPAPTLFKLQNLFQAVVATASLLALSPSHPPSSPTSFSQRIWTLLEGEAIKGGYEAPETKLINLEDEVVRVYGKDKEESVRVGVRAILRTEDPVFKLLGRRVRGFLDEAVVATRKDSLVPVKLTTGRKRLSGTPTGDDHAEMEEKLASVKGFEDPVLQEGLKKILRELRLVVGWVEFVWSDVLTKAS